MKNRRLLALSLFFGLAQAGFGADQVASVTQLSKEMKQLQSKIAQLQTRLDTLHAEKTTSQKKQLPTDRTTNANARYQISPIDIGMPTFVAPYMDGFNAQYHPSDLMISASDTNKDIFILQRQAKTKAALGEHGLKPAEHPVVSFSGEFEGLLSGSHSYTGQANSSVNISNLQLNTLMQITDWARSYVILAYTDPNVNLGGRTNHSRLYVKNAFATIGDLTQSPYYTSIGQLYVPFGRFNSSMIDANLVSIIGETIQKALVIGYHQPDNNAFYSSAYIGDGDANKSGNTNRLNLWGLDAGYAHHSGEWVYEFGASYLNNMANALGQQDTFGKGFTGFGSSTANESLTHFVPALDVYSVLGHGPYGGIAEYTAAIKPYAQSNLSFNQHGAQPKAMYLEGNYSFHLGKHDAEAAFSYGQSWEALALNVPAQRIMAALNTEMFPNTVLSVELRHDINYGKGQVAAGQGDAVGDSNALGKSSNAILAQLKLYY